MTCRHPSFYPRLERFDSRRGGWFWASLHQAQQAPTSKKKQRGCLVVDRASNSPLIGLVGNALNDRCLLSDRVWPIRRSQLHPSTPPGSGCVVVRVALKREAPAPLHVGLFMSTCWSVLQRGGRRGGRSDAWDRTVSTVLPRSAESLDREHWQTRPLLHPAYYP